MISISLIHWRRLSRIAFASAIVLISYLAFSSDPPQVATRLSDKLNHTLAFFTLAYILDQTAQRLPVVRGLVLPLFAYGVFVEAVQGQLGYREMSWLDVGADCVGIFLYLAFRVHWQRVLAYFVTLK